MFGWPEAPQRIIDFYNFSLVRNASYPDCKGPPLIWIASISDKLYFFLQNEIILLFSKLIIGTSEVFSTHSYVYLHRYTQIRGGGGGGIYAPTPGGK